MRFMVMSRIDEHSETGAMPSPEVMTNMMALMEELTNAGVLVSGEGLQPTSTGTRLKLSGGEVSLTDGPFPRSEWPIANFAILEVATKEDAIYWAERWARLFGELECEIRPLAVGPDPSEMSA